LPAGDYTVSEDLQGYTVVGLIVNGAELPPQPTYSFSWPPNTNASEPVIVFKNSAGGDPDSRLPRF
jgi:hypothetical protein